MFPVRLHQRAHFIQVSARLDEVAQSIRDEFPELSENTPRRKAELIAGYLVRSKLTGVAEDSQYHNLQNNFIGLALNSSHAALPLISVGIFCSVAERLGLVAVPCGFPFHVYAIVIAPDDQGLDEAPPTDQSPPQLMYMDPFRSDREVPRSDLEAQLRTMGVPPDEHETQLGVSSVAEMVRRTARNIIGSVQATRHVHEGSNESNEAQYPESDGALYAAVWALMLVPDDNAALFPHARYLPYIMDYLEKQSFFDVRLVEMYMLPLFEGSQQLQQLREAIHVIRVGDSVPKPVYCRPVGSKRIPFRVGQVFRHKRYHYQGVITGWDIECAAGEAWMAQMGVDRLPRGRHQSFYHVLYVHNPRSLLSYRYGLMFYFSVEDNSVRYVAEENIADTNIDAGSSLMALAGRHFKRWDAASKTFVSNIRDEYPDD